MLLAQVKVAWKTLVVGTYTCGPGWCEEMRGNGLAEK